MYRMSNRAADIGLVTNEQGSGMHLSSCMISKHINNTKEFSDGVIREYNVTSDSPWNILYYGKELLIAFVFRHGLSAFRLSYPLRIVLGCTRSLIYG